MIMPLVHEQHWTHWISIRTRQQTVAQGWIQPVACFHNTSFTGTQLCPFISHTHCLWLLLQSNSRIEQLDQTPYSLYHKASKTLNTIWPFTENICWPSPSNATLLPVIQKSLTFRNKIYWYQIRDMYWDKSFSNIYHLHQCLWLTALSYWLSYCYDRMMNVS